MMKIGVIPDSFDVPFRDAVVLARDMGAKGLQPYVTKGRMAPEVLTKDDRRELLQFVRDNGLEFSALCADFGMNFARATPEGLQRSMWMMELAVDLDTHIITTHIGRVPEDETSAEYATMVKNIETLGRYGDKIGVVFATETGPESALRLRGMLEKADTKSAKVNLDPANFVMVAEQDPVEAVYILKDYIAHTHAKDGIKLPDGTHRELPLGQGNVPFDRYIAALKDVGYDGFLTIERESGPTRRLDIQNGYALLDGILKKLY